ncbi:zeta toxin family protein [Cellulomonas cellasea]|uniref:UDP-N-acetylglucosamine kinase n=1 Tax=Cellulomonas cellasea TaxID=43670 RepID=A0A7W4UHS6_9CELL|nr:zeta toxin family protein [Cellulomonas cellasea]MBB2924404.1 chloramphenicol 3-O-phosphotransferase [Cellulomonas cellasea]
MTEQADDPTAPHRETVRAFCQAGGPLDPTGPNATTANPDWFRGRDVRRPTAQRDALHRRLLAEARAEQPAARQERRAIVLAGPPGAGKSTVLRDVIGVDKSAWLTIDADEFKQKLLREALADGSYEQFLKPAPIKDREDAGERFFPLERAALVHEESSLLANQLQARALQEGTNVIIDSVLSNPDKAVALGERLVRAGYTVEVIDVEVPFDLSQQRIAGRWRESYESALLTGDGLGQRWGPTVTARSGVNETTGRSKSQESAADLANARPAAQRFRRFWTPEQAALRVVEIDQSRRASGGPLLDTTLIQNATRGQSARPPPPGREHDAGTRINRIETEVGALTSRDRRAPWRWLEA